LGSGGLSAVSHGDHLETVGTGVTAAELINSQGDNEIAWFVGHTAGALSDSVVSPPNASESETFMEVDSNISGGTAGD